MRKMQMQRKSRELRILKAQIHKMVIYRFWDASVNVIQLHVPKIRMDDFVPDAESATAESVNARKASAGIPATAHPMKHRAEKME